jgi:hypothetical protein
MPQGYVALLDMRGIRTWDGNNDVCQFLQLTPSPKEPYGMDSEIPSFFYGKHDVPRVSTGADCDQDISGRAVGLYLSCENTFETIIVGVRSEEG